MVLTDVEDPNGPCYIDKRFSRNDSKNRRKHWTLIKVMVSLGYRRVDEFENPSEELKEAIRIITNNPERTAENIEAVKTIITELRTLQKENDDINEKNKK